MFLTNDKNLIYNNCILYFYCSDNLDFLNKIIITELEKRVNVICIDLVFYKNMYKRFDVKETPTILVIKDGLETKRINGLPSFNDINNIFAND